MQNSSVNCINKKSMQTVNLQKAASKQKYVCEILRLTSDKCHFVTIVTHFFACLNPFYHLYNAF